MESTWLFIFNRKKQLLKEFLAYTLLGIIMTGIKWWVFGNFAILKPVFIFTSHNKYRPLSFWGSQGV